MNLQSFAIGTHVPYSTNAPSCAVKFHGYLGKAHFTDYSRNHFLVQILIHVIILKLSCPIGRICISQFSIVKDVYCVCVCLCH